ncbi:hypothetical protein ACJ73_10130 [Blastomyces percursus]|uniref:Uncharacterized protein n=1 Tax=Blastomyces percursus TaxID=1658174 RepID=A0A1J9Q3I1_9EURO|nr:hypothetical protein ACJ73_10130 [Blastomyces percursus]
MYSFSRPDLLRRHVQACHLRYLDPDALLWCPHPSCPDVVDGVKDFQGHALLVHNAGQTRKATPRQRTITGAIESRDHMEIDNDLASEQDGNATSQQWHESCDKGDIKIRIIKETA